MFGKEMADKKNVDAEITNTRGEVNSELINLF